MTISPQVLLAIGFLWGVGFVLWMFLFTQGLRWTLDHFVPWQDAKDNYIKLLERQLAEAQEPQKTSSGAATRTSRWAAR